MARSSCIRSSGASYRPGGIKQREAILSALADLPQAEVATDPEVLVFIDRHRLSGRGIGYIDAHLLAAARLTGAALWSRDRLLNQISAQLDLSWHTGFH